MMKCKGDVILSFEQHILDINLMKYNMIKLYTCTQVHLFGLEVIHYI